MPLVKTIQKRISEVERFDVIITHPDGSDVKDNKDIPKQYSYTNAMAGKFTVAYWIESRFQIDFPGYSAVVLDGSGSPVIGQTLLSNVRKTYNG